jgi:hypothetical protein
MLSQKRERAEAIGKRYIDRIRYVPSSQDQEVSVYFSTLSFLHVGM